MTDLPSARRPLGLAVPLLIAAAVACGDGASTLRTASGYYRIVSVNGQALPYQSPPRLGLSMRIRRGDLVLRPNGSYSHGIGADVGFGFLAEGTYRLLNGQIVFSPWGPSTDGDLV